MTPEQAAIIALLDRMELLEADLQRHRDAMRFQAVRITRLEEELKHQRKKGAA